MTGWRTIRVVLSGQAGHALAQPPGRVLLAHADHTLATLADAIDTAFGRWDLTPLHLFEVEGRTIPCEGAPDDDHEDTGEVTLGELDLAEGDRFRYVFDLGEGWLHDCTLEALHGDLEDLDADEPELPVPIYGWGTIPDQYGVLVADGPDELTELGASAPGGGTRDDEDDRYGDDDEEDDEDDWRAASAASWAVVERALADVPRARDDEGLAVAAADLRDLADEGHEELGVATLYAAADLEAQAAPEDDEELWTLLAAGVVEPEGDIDLDDELVAAWMSLEPADWAGAVIELVRSGLGTVASPEALIELVERCPEVEGEELTEADEAVLLEGLEVVVTLWQVLGAVDDDGTLTPLGLWGLPRALERAWLGG
jgi:hypothetical protein